MQGQSAGLAIDEQINQGDDAQNDKKEESIDILVDELMDQTSSSCNMYLVLVYVAVGMGIGCTSYFYYQIPFMIQKPVYSCQLTDPMIEILAEICTAENICSKDPRIHSWAVDYSNENSIHNWV